MVDIFDIDQNETQLIVFQLEREEYAIPITCIQEIIMLQKPTRIPKAPLFVEGIINLRGHIIPIIDGRKKFNLEVNNNNQAEQRIIVVEIDTETIGLIVDSVSEVVYLSRADVEPTPTDVKNDNDVVLGIGKYKDRLLILLNPEKFLTFGESNKLVDLSKVAENLKSSDLLAGAA